MIFKFIYFLQKIRSYKCIHPIVLSISFQEVRYQSMWKMTTIRIILCAVYRKVIILERFQLYTNAKLLLMSSVKIIVLWQVWKNPVWNILQTNLLDCLSLWRRIVFSIQILGCNSKSNLSNKLITSMKQFMTKNFSTNYIFIFLNNS